MSLKFRVLPNNRIGQLRSLLDKDKSLRVIEAHDGLSGILGATAKFDDLEFDCLWISSLTDSTAKGHPDVEVVDISSRLQTIQEILSVTHKPLIVDGDTGGDPIQFEYFCSKLEALGVSAVVIEDKKYPKRNSLVHDSEQNLEDPHVFATKINRAKSICLSSEFMIFARIESFIANLGLDDAIMRAEIYLDSKADGLMIHSKEASASQVIEFMHAYKNLCKKKGVQKPVICVPTTYHHVTCLELFAEGFNIVVYANQSLRAAYKAIQEMQHSILKYGRSFEGEHTMASITEIMNLVGFTEVKEKDLLYKI